ncbi:DNA polymerase [Burkholderia phage Bm1]
MKPFPDITQYPVIALDTETTGLVYPRDKAFGVSLSLPGPNPNDYSPAGDGFKAYWDIRRQPEIKRKLNSALSSYNGTVVFANAHFDCKMLHGAGVEVPLRKVDDVITRAVQINEQLMEYNLDYLAKKYIGRSKVSDIYQALADMFGGKPTRQVQMPNLHRAPPELVAPYAEEDTAVTLALWFWQQAEIERQGLEQICEFEQSVFPTLQRMTRRGIRVDEQVAEEAQGKLTTIIDADQTRLNELVGFDINVNSSPQIKKVFQPKQVGEGKTKVWVADNGHRLETTDSGQPSIPSPVLREMDGDERAKLIVAIRSNIKTRDTFLGGHILGHAVEGRVYPTINQSKGEDGGTGTGRLSYQDPAMQQIPSRNKVVAAIVKPAFLPDEGEDWADSDMASFEVRVFAHLVKDERILKQYRDDPLSDFHQMVADLTHLPRNATYSGEPNAKQLNLSMIFNSGNGAIAEKMGMPWEWDSFESRGTEIVFKRAGPEAMEVINNYHRRLPGVKSFAERAKAVAEDRGWVRDQFGRRFRFPRGFKSYKASGIIIQMTAASMNKKALTVVEDALGRDGNLLLNTHDSYSMSIRGERERVFGRVQEAVQDSFPWFRVPVVMELTGFGKNWWDAVRKDK